MSQLQPQFFGHFFGHRNQQTRSDNKKGTLSDRLKPGRDWILKNGAKETRTPDPLHAMQVLYQLSYGPITTWWLQNRRSSYDSLHR